MPDVINPHQGNWGHFDPRGLFFFISQISSGLKPYATMTLSHYATSMHHIRIILIRFVSEEIEKIMSVGSI